MRAFVPVRKARNGPIQRCCRFDIEELNARETNTLTKFQDKTQNTNWIFIREVAEIVRVAPQLNDVMLDILNSPNFQITNESNESSKNLSETRNIEWSIEWVVTEEENFPAMFSIRNV